MAANNTIIHGHNRRGARTKTYAAWRSMKQRCLNINNKNYLKYGGRGIKICDSWMNFNNFLADMGEAQKGMTLERINTELGYSPENCKWASQLEQVRNRRISHRLTYKDKNLHLKEWAQIFDIKYETLRKRIAKGWDAEMALTTPVYSAKACGQIGGLKKAGNQKTLLDSLEKARLRD